MEMRCDKRMMKIKWTESISNEEVLRRVGEKRNIMKTLRRRGRFIGHTSRHSSQIKTILKGKISGKNYRERPRMEYIEQMMKDVKTRMKRLAEHREDWRTATNQSLD
jgi:hypothetical protein